MSPKVSVIIPTYNRAKLVVEAIQSVLNQTYQDYELIIIDDGSIDNTKQEIQKLNIPTIQYYYQENGGVSSAINTGILKSKGQYILLLSSDNILLSNAMMDTVTFMEQHPEAGFCCGQSFTIDALGKLTREKLPRGPKRTEVIKGQQELEKLLSGIQNIDTLVTRRSCYDKVGLYNTDLRMSEDWDMLIRLTNIYDVGLIAKPLGLIRNHAISLVSQTKVEEVKKAHTKVLEAAFSDPGIANRYNNIRKKSRAGLNLLLARTACRTNERIKGLFYLLTAIINYPKLLITNSGIKQLLRTGEVFIPLKIVSILSRSLVTLKLR